MPQKPMPVKGTKMVLVRFDCSDNFYRYWKSTRHRATKSAFNEADRTPNPNMRTVAGVYMWMMFPAGKNNTPSKREVIDIWEP